MSEERFVGALALAVGVGVIARLIIIWTTTSPGEPLNLFYPGFTDGTAYLNNARSLVETGVYGYGGRVSAFRPPAYPFVLAASLKLFGPSLTPVRLIQILLFVIMTACYASAAARACGRLAGIAVAAAFSVYPLFVFITTEIATESLYMALGALVFTLASRLLERRHGGGMRAVLGLATGLCCGAGILTRPNMLFVALLVLGLILMGVGGGRERIRSRIVTCACVIAGTSLVALPWVARNERRLGAPVLTTNLDYNLFRGTFDLIHGIPGGRNIALVFKDHDVLYEKDIEDPGRRHLPFDEITNEHHARAAALKMIRSDPGGWIKERIRNVVYLWLNLEWERSLTGRRSIVLAAVFVTVVYYLLLAGAIIGSLAVRHPPACRYIGLAWLFVLAAMPVVIAFVGKRYRVSMIDPYLILALCGALGALAGPPQPDLASPASAAPPRVGSREA